MGVTAALIAVSLVGGLVQGVGAYQAAQAQAQAAEYNARVAAENARTSLAQAGIDAREKQRERIRHIGKIVNGAGANGVNMTGAMLDVANNEYLKVTRDVNKIKYWGDVKYTDFMNQSEGFKMEAEYASASAGIGLVTGLLDGVGSALQVA